MAYKRWGYSNWYIFWHTSDARTKEEELLAIWHVADKNAPVFSYADLKCIKTVDDLKALLNLNIPDDEYQEALQEIKFWLQDVERSYE